MIPDNLSPTIRNAVRAWIRRDDRVLLLKKQGEPLGLRYALPGGAQQVGEPLEQALQRECREEIGTRVESIRLLHVADFYKARNTTPPTTTHQVEFLFACQVPGDYQATMGPQPDRQQTDVVWIPLQQLAQIPLLPPGIAAHLLAAGSADKPCYLGTLS